MKNKIFALILILAAFSPFFAQNYYDTQWKKIADNYKKGQVKSNLPLILEIQNQAMKEDNASQLIRSLKAEFSVINQTYDDTKNDSSTQFFAKLQGLDQKLKGEDQLVYQVLLREFFNDYYNENQWKINQRTNINNQDLSQIETWSKLDFKNYLTANFKKSADRKADLQKISMSKYKEIFERNEDLEYFPTLFEWNAIKEIDFLKNGQLFTPNELKVNQQKVSGLYSELIARNSGDVKLYFQHQKINDECAFINCKNRIEQLESLVKNTSTEGDYKVAITEDILETLIGKEDFENTLVWVKEAKEKYPKSKFINNIKNKENQIIAPNLTIHYETHTQADKPIHLVAEAKNISKFSLNIYEVKNDEQNFLKYVVNQYDKATFPAIKKSLVRKELFDVQDLKDYKNHKTSLEIKSLPSGLYVAEYVVENSIQQNFYFIVTNSRIVYHRKDDVKNTNSQLQLVNRENGKLAPNQTLKIFELADRKSTTIFDGKTDATAIFKFPSSANQAYYRSYLVKQTGTNDYNYLQVYGDNNYYERRNNQQENSAQIFIDRGIYRPGQTVYFKVINTKLLNDQESVAVGIQQKIILNDANGEEISSQNFTTNEFGSYNGNFILPNGKLNGGFSLKVDSDNLDNDAYKSFQVEEYKRPKFEVTFEPIKSEYKYGETVELKGKAMMFSGVSLSNATVNYEIKKQNIRWRYFWWYPRGNDNENSILGEVKTNEKGEFSIKIDLKKDETLDGIQIDNYQINASVTDINGETQSATENVKVASVSHYINADEIKDQFTDEPVKVKVETKNYNDQNLTKPYQVKLSKLQPKERVFRNNFENQIQDLPKLSKSEFVQKFPHDYFSKEEKDAKTEKVIVEKTQQPSTDNQPSTLDLGKLQAGNYKLELFNIEGKDTIKTEKLFEVFDKKSLSNSQKPFLKVIQPKTEYQRNEKAKIYVYSAVSDAMVKIYVQNGNGETTTEELPLKNGVLEYEVAFPKDVKVDQLNVQFQLIAFNDVQTANLNLSIASDKKPLQIETVTFRDKLQPGQKEKWTVKVLGNDKEKINAEVLANMYDKSLDQFAINTYSWQEIYQRFFTMNSYGINDGLAQENYSKRTEYFDQKYISIPEFNWFDGNFYGNQLRIRSAKAMTAKMEVMSDSAAVVSEMEVVQNVAPSPVNAPKIDGGIEEVAMIGGGSRKKENLDKIQVRQNLNETAFFYPNLLTDKDGNITFEFTSPEALTQWKLMFLAHTKDARSATLEKEVVTQKEFSVTPNYPRFLREGDELNLQSKLSSLVDKKLNGVAQLQILDAFTNEDISEKFGITQLTAVSGFNKEQSFLLAENGNSVVNWKVKVPNNVSSIIIKVVAKAGNFSDGEQKAIAILPNRMLVTDAVPIFVKEGQTKTFTLENLAKNTSKTAANFLNTLELTTNPIWEIMFALPSLKNDSNNSADVVFNKWFADVLAAEIFKANPKLKTVFEEYQSKGLLTSNLEKNQELKQLLLEETPWVLESKNETEQMEKLARLFDANTMRNSIQNDWSEVLKLQNPDGGFSWYQGYPSSYYNSLYILKNLGKINEWLKGNTSDYQSSEQKEMVKKLVQYVDSEVHKYWDVKKEMVWNNYVLDYLDTRHYWEKEYPLSGKGAQLKTLVVQKAPKADIKDFTFFGLHRAALLFNEYKLPAVSKKLMTYLKETSTDTETQGVYWKQNLNDWGWYSSKTVNHAGALDAFNQLTPNDINFIEEMKIWLITQKEVNSWGSSRGTAEVIFTILNSGKSWTSNDSEKATIVWGGKELTNPDTKATGYVKSTLKSEKVDNQLGTVTITKPGSGIVQGGLFWQYYEDLDKIKSSENYVSITKELYKKIKTVNGEELVKISENSPLKVGDKVTVRMTLNTDRNMEFIHIKDMRAAGFEPLNVISGYEWKNSLGYYQSTKDASTNFYIENMRKGKYIFEYDYVCNASGTFSNGITTLQNYYAPQMNAHTKGTKVTIAE